MVSPVRIQVPLPFFQFQALPVYIERPGGQAVKTPPFHGGNTGSIPVRVTTLLCRICGGIAQPVERPPHTRKVTDSSSVVSTKPETFCFRFLFLFPPFSPQETMRRSHHRNRPDCNFTLCEHTKPETLRFGFLFLLLSPVCRQHLLFFTHLKLAPFRLYPIVFYGIIFPDPFIPQT